MNNKNKNFIISPKSKHIYKRNLITFPNHITYYIKLVGSIVCE